MPCASQGISKYRKQVTIHYYLRSDAGSRFLIGNKQIVMQVGMNPDSPTATGNLNLQAGLHPIQLEYTHGDGESAQLELM